MLYKIVGLTGAKLTNSGLLTQAVFMDTQRSAIVGWVEGSGMTRPELVGQPKLADLAGPMYDGEAAGPDGTMQAVIRYETWDAYKTLST